LSPIFVPHGAAACRAGSEPPSRQRADTDGCGLVACLSATLPDQHGWSSRPELDAVVAALNSRPRKTLGWKTPAEAFSKHLCSPTGSVATTP
jgi:hypothetical protein